jgi:hypothetical protein
MRAFFVFLLVACSPLLGVDGLFVSWDEDPTTTMCITWITRDKENAGALYYKQKASEGAWIEAAVTRKPAFQKPYYVHKVALDNLEPDTIYRFHLGNKEQSYFFRTMPKKITDSLRFVAGGDAYNNSFKKYRAMCVQAAKENPRFVIIGGDIAYSIDKEIGEDDWEKWLRFFRCWQETMVDKEGCLIPLLVTIGNHEVLGSFNRSRREAMFYYLFFEKTSYALAFGDYLHLTFLDSEHTQQIKGAQTAWLRSVLKNSQHFQHRFAIYHVGAYPSNSKYDFYLSKKVRKHWVPLFEKYRVHACFESHDHAYKRTYPLLEGRKDPKGVVYFGDGSWGVTPRKPATDRPYLAHATETQQVLVVKLLKEGRKYWAVDPEGHMIDYFEQL